MQRFLVQRIFEDGQTSVEGRPDRAESDQGDNELSDADDADTPARTASLGMGYKQPGTPDSLEEFLAAGDDTATSPAATLDADAPPAPKRTVSVKRPWDETGSVGEAPPVSRSARAKVLPRRPRLSRPWLGWRRLHSTSHPFGL